MARPWKIYFKKKDPLHFTTDFHSFAFKIETSWAIRVVKPILKNINANYVSMYIYGLVIRGWKTKKRGDAM